MSICIQRGEVLGTNADSVKFLLDDRPTMRHKINRFSMTADCAGVNDITGERGAWH